MLKPYIKMCIEVIYHNILLRATYLFLLVSHLTCNLLLIPLKVLILKSLLHHWSMHTTCFDQHWSSSGVSKIVDETAVLSSKVQFLGHVLVYEPMCPVVMGSSSYCHVQML
jgi:hypothetical protein